MSYSNDLSVQTSDSFPLIFNQSIEKSSVAKIRLFKNTIDHNFLSQVCVNIKKFYFLEPEGCNENRK
jgi:hypothetical protein